MVVWSINKKLDRFWKLAKFSTIGNLTSISKIQAQKWKLAFSFATLYSYEYIFRHRKTISLEFSHLYYKTCVRITHMHLRGFKKHVCFQSPRASRANRIQLNSILLPFLESSTMIDRRQILGLWLLLKWPRLSWNFHGSCIKTVIFSRLDPWVIHKLRREDSKDFLPPFVDNFTTLKAYVVRCMVDIWLPPSLST